MSFTLVFPDPVGPTKLSVCSVLSNKSLVGSTHRSKISLGRISVVSLVDLVNFFQRSMNFPIL